MSKHSHSTDNVCLLCNCKDTTMIARHSEECFNTDVFYCYRCEFGYCYPMPTNSDLEKFYKNQYSALRWSDPKDRRRTDHYYNEKKHDASYLRALDQYIYVQNHLERATKTMSVLDVGCNVGALLDFFQKSGCDVTGCEADPKTASRAIPSVRGNILNEFDYYKIANSKKFDLITFSHVLEHFNDVMVLMHYKKLLTDGGLLFIEVPNEPKLHIGYRIRSQRWGHHLLFFSEKSLRILCEKLGLELIEDSIMAYGRKDGLDKYLKKMELRTNAGTSIRMIYRKNEKVSQK